MIAALAAIPNRGDLDIGDKVRGARCVSVSRRDNGNTVCLGLTFGTWQGNTYQPGVLCFDVSAVQPSRTFKTAAGAARAASRWMARP